MAYIVIMSTSRLPSYTIVMSCGSHFFISAPERGSVFHRKDVVMAYIVMARARVRVPQKRSEHAGGDPARARVAPDRTTAVPSAAYIVMAYIVMA